MPTLKLSRTLTQTLEQLKATLGKPHAGVLQMNPSILQERFSALKPTLEYAFLWTEPNSGAVYTIRKHSHALTKAYYARDGGRAHPGVDGRTVLYDGHLRTVYEQGLDWVLDSENLWRVSYEGVAATGERHPLSVLFPRIHCVKAKDLHEVEDAIESMACHPGLLARLQEQQAPQNYQLDAIEFLAKNEVAPLAVRDTGVRMTGKQVTDALTVLAPWSFTNDPYAFMRGSMIDED